MVMGTPRQAISEDPGFVMLTDYEKKYLNPLNETFIKHGKELVELERNFLEGFFLMLIPYFNYKINFTIFI